MSSTDWIYKPSNTRVKSNTKTNQPSGKKVRLPKSTYWKNFCKFGNVEGFHFHAMSASACAEEGVALHHVMSECGAVELNADRDGVETMDGTEEGLGHQDEQQMGE